MTTVRLAMQMSAASNDALEAFEGTVRRQSGRLFGLAFSILGDAGEAEDAVQETMLKAWRAWGSVRDRERQDAWLTRICVNHCLRRRRGLLGRRRLAHDGWDGRATEAPGPRPDGQDVDLDRACRGLSRRQRAVVTLHYHHGYGLDECARLMGCRPGTVRSHLARALTALRQELGHV